MNMTVEQLLRALDKHPDAFISLGNPHSWRGNYEDMALEPMWALITAANLAELIRNATTLRGWKGGEYPVTPKTIIWVSCEGASEPLALHGVRFLPYANVIVPLIVDVDNDCAFPGPTIDDLAVGDTATVHGEKITVLFKGRDSAFVKYEFGKETSISLLTEVER